MNDDESPLYSRRAAIGLATIASMFPAFAGRAQAPAAKALRGLDVGPIAWRNIRTDFGAIGDGRNSDFVAFRAFRNWALAQTGWVGLVMPPSSGHYVTSGNYGGGVINAPFFGIKKLVVSGYGASMDGLHGSALTNNQSVRHKIRSVNAGSKTVELIQRSETRFLAAGSMVLLAGLDLQGGWGYPPNCHFNEWHRIASVSGGRVMFDRPIKYDYSDDWPRYFEGHQYELGGIGPAAICRTVPGWDCEHRIYGLRSTASGQTYYFVRKAILVDCRSDAQGFIIGASEDHQIVGQEHTTSNMEVDKLTTNGLIGEYGPFNRSIQVQSSSVDRLTVRGGTRSINGTAKNMLIYGGSSPSIVLGPTAYGITEELVIRDHVIGKFIEPQMYNSLDNKLSYEGGGVFRYTGSSAPQWLIPGAVGIIQTDSPFYDHHIFRVLRVKSETGVVGSAVLIQTDIVGDTLPEVSGVANAKIIRHHAPRLTVENCTGSPEALELSLAPAKSPYGIISRRTYDGTPYQKNGTTAGPLRGRLVHLKITVTKAYTGMASVLTIKLGQFGYAVINADKSVTTSHIRVNCKIAGERVITSSGVTGEQTGDVGLSDLTGGVWMPKSIGAFFGAGTNGSTAVDISAEAGGVRPIVTIECLTDQEFA